VPVNAKACRVTIQGEFGFPIDAQKAASLRAAADGDDLIWF